MARLVCERMDQATEVVVAPQLTTIEQLRDALVFAVNAALLKYNTDATGLSRLTGALRNTLTQVAANTSGDVFYATVTDTFPDITAGAPISYVVNVLTNSTYITPGFDYVLSISNLGDALPAGLFLEFESPFYRISGTTNVSPGQFDIIIAATRNGEVTTSELILNVV